MFNPIAILAVISSMYEQIEALQKENAELLNKLSNMHTE